MTDNVVQLPLKMPPNLAGQVESLTRPSDPAFADFPPLEPAHDPAAGEWLRRKRELIKQSDRDQCREWLLLLVLGINGVSEDAFKAREMAVWEMCRDLPDFVWCADTRRIMWKRTPFLPSPGECHEVLEAYAAPLLREIKALERIARTPPPKPQTIAPPYVPPAAPEWTTSRAVERTPLYNPHPPVRSVEEQIAALKATGPDPPQAAD